MGALKEPHPQLSIAITINEHEDPAALKTVRPGKATELKDHFKQMRRKEKKNCFDTLNSLSVTD